MTHYLLDTNIICNVVKLQPSALLLDWMAGLQDEDLYIIASLTVAEIRRGILERPSEKKGMPWKPGSLAATDPKRCLQGGYCRLMTRQV